MTLSRHEKIRAIAVLLAPRLGHCGEFANEVFLAWAERILKGEKAPMWIDHVRLWEILNLR